MQSPDVSTGPARKTILVVDAALDGVVTALLEGKLAAEGETAFH